MRIWKLTFILHVFLLLQSSLRSALSVLQQNCLIWYFFYHKQVQSARCDAITCVIKNLCITEFKNPPRARPTRARWVRYHFLYICSVYLWPLFISSKKTAKKKHISCMGALSYIFFILYILICENNNSLTITVHEIHPDRRTVRMTNSGVLIIRSRFTLWVRNHKNYIEKLIEAIIHWPVG